MRKQIIEYTSSLDALIALTKQLNTYEIKYQMNSEEPGRSLRGSQSRVRDNFEAWRSRNFPFKRACVYGSFIWSTALRHCVSSSRVHDTLNWLIFDPSLLGSRSHWSLFGEFCYKSINQFLLVLFLAANYTSDSAYRWQRLRGTDYRVPVWDCLQRVFSQCCMIPSWMLDNVRFACSF